MLSRDEYRKIKSMSREEMSKWLNYHNIMMDNNLRKTYNNAYRDELDSSVQNFITAIAYTLHFSDEVTLQKDELASFMEDLFVSVEMFRKGEYNPEEYREQLKEDGIEIAKYDYDKLYREQGENIKKQYLPYKERNEKAIKWLEDWFANGATSCNLGDLQTLQNILEGEL